MSGGNLSYYHIKFCKRPYKVQLRIRGHWTLVMNRKLSSVNIRNNKNRYFHLTSTYNLFNILYIILQLYCWDQLIQNWLSWLAGPDFMVPVHPHSSFLILHMYHDQIINNNILNIPWFLQAHAYKTVP